MKNKRVLFVANNSDIVILRFRKEVLQTFAMKGYDVTLVSPESVEIQVFCDANNIKHISVDMSRRGKNPFKDFFLLIKYCKIIKKENPDYIFSYTIKPNIYVGLVNLFFKKKFYPNITGLGSVFAKKNILTKIVSVLYKVAFKSATKVFFQNSSNKAVFVDNKIIGCEKSIMLPGSGVNLTENKFAEYSKDSGVIKFVFLGRIMAEKGVYELLEAFSILEKKHKNIQLDMYGFCEENNEKFLKKVDELKSVYYHGFTSSSRDVIAESHALILPSYHEGLSNVLLEAAAMGRPVIATNIPGCKETFEDGVSGFACEPRDVVSLEKALINFIKLSYDDKISMGKNARIKIQKEFDRNIVIDKYMQQVS